MSLMEDFRIQYQNIFATSGYEICKWSDFTSISCVARVIYKNKQSIGTDGLSFARNTALRCDNGAQISRWNKTDNWLVKSVTLK